jgi:hypothetical protein
VQHISFLQTGKDKNRKTFHSIITKMEQAGIC